MERQLAETIARAALAEPYRQVPPMTTYDMVGWLDDRGIRLHWETLHHFWSLGLLHPVAVLEEAFAETGVTERFVELDLGLDNRTFIDLGAEVSPDAEFAVPLLRLPNELNRALLWHPYHLWVFHRLRELLRVPIATEMVLRGAQPYAELAAEHINHIPDSLRKFARDPVHEEFQRVLALLLLVEPLVHPWIDTRVRLPIHEDDLGGYDTWRHTADGVAVLDLVRLPVERVEFWHRELAILAQLDDPLESFRTLLRHVSREERQKLKGAALRADGLYEAAEVLRRYAELFHHCTWVEEDDARHGPRGAAVKQGLFGAPRTGDFDRAVFRRLVRQYGLDPQPRVTWFVEGDTEVAFVRQWSAMNEINLGSAGIEIMNVRGVGGIASDRLRELLERYRREEAYAFISLDYDDGGDHIRTLRRYADERLLVSGYRVWQPDFESANYTPTELASIANELAAESGIAVRVTGDDIARTVREQRLAAFKSISKLWSAAHFQAGKGERWGRALAHWSFNHSAPPELSEDGNRPIEAVTSFLLSLHWADYPLSLQETYVDDSGKVQSRAK